MFRRIKPAGAEIVLTESQFQVELKKEVFRSDRRECGRELGLIRLQSEGGDLPAEFFDSDDFHLVLGRLRITDSIGWYHGDLAVLLPESSREGSLTLANEVVEILSNSSWNVNAVVSTYPLDDELVSVSEEIRAMSKSIQDDSEDEDSDDDFFHDGRRDPGHRGAPKPNSKSFAGSNETNNGDLGNEVFAFSGMTAVAEHPPTKMPQVRRQKIQLSEKVVEKKHRFVQPVKTPWSKRAIDIFGSSLGLILLSPVLVVAAIAIRLSSKGPVFFLQMREGKDGRKFGILKFRTMVANAESLKKRLRSKSEQDGPAFKLANDPRVTKVGRYLRKSCIDELPQLWNVLKGDMSLVGPRPLPVDESLACTAWQRARLTVLPGLTCTWQAYGGRDVKFAQWMQMDLDYIERRSFWFDLKLICDTACIALMHRGSV
jgi:lipopolysaccharide/colanic/teichoic acid biosynthesis glycosyltransferase